MTGRALCYVSNQLAATLKYDRRRLASELLAEFIAATKVQEPDVIAFDTRGWKYEYHRRRDKWVQVYRGEK